MTHKDARFARIRDLLEAAAPYSELRIAFTDLLAVPLAQVAEPDLQVVVDLLRELQEQTLEQSDAATQIITMCVLPLLDQEVEGLEGFGRTVAECRRILVAWIDQYTGTTRTRVRNHVLDVLLMTTKERNPQSFGWTIRQIGFRRDDVVDALWGFVSANNDEFGDNALLTIASVGVPPDARALVLTTAHERAVQRYTTALMWTLHRLADPASVPIIAHAWLHPTTSTFSSWGSLERFQLLAHIADVHHDNSELQDTIWYIITQTIKQYGELFMSAIYLGSAIAPSCDSPQVIRDLLYWLEAGVAPFAETAHERYLVAQRLEACVRPRQLEGWERHSQTDIPSKIRTDANQNTHVGERFSIETNYKEAAWKIAFQLGSTEILSWFETAIAQEENPDLQATLCTLLAHLALQPLPHRAVQWVTEPYDADPSTDSRTFLVRTAAVQLVGSAGSREAFDALLHFGILHRGRVLQSTTEALVMSVRARLAAGDPTVVRVLVDTVTKSHETHHRLGALVALEDVASRDTSLVRDDIGLLERALLEEDRDDVERALLVAVLALVPSSALTETTIEHFITWARTQRDQLALRALAALALLGRLEQLPDVLTNVLGLTQHGDTWTMSLSTSVSRVNDRFFTLGLLYRTHPHVFVPAMASVIAKGSWSMVLPLLYQLVYVHRTAEQSVPLDPAITDALLARVNDPRAQMMAEVDVFPLLARLIPERLVSEPWDTRWDEWLPEARAALADALGHTPCTEPQATANAVSLLTLLVHDSQYMVRRMAYRSLVQLAPAHLNVLWHAWAHADTYELRMLAAEGNSWIALSGADEVIGQRVYHQLMQDAERAVRDVAERAHNERQERQWATTYIHAITQVEQWTNEEVLRLWRYGQALTQIGDDACQQALQDYLDAVPRPPYVIAWLQYVIKGIVERWRKVLVKAPDPWFGWTGAIETGKGVLILPDEQRVAVDYSLWHQPAATPSDTASWGGALWPVHIVIAFNMETFVIQLSDGRTGTGLQTNIQSSLVLFVGQERYPGL